MFDTVLSVLVTGGLLVTAFGNLLFSDKNAPEF